MTYIHVSTIGRWMAVPTRHAKALEALGAIFYLENLGWFSLMPKDVIQCPGTFVI